MKNVRLKNIPTKFKNAVSTATNPNGSANIALKPTANGFKQQLSPTSNLDDQTSGPTTISANNAPNNGFKQQLSPTTINAKNAANILDKGLTLTKKYTNQICYSISEVSEYERKAPTKLQLWQNRKARKNTLDKTLVFATK